MKPLKFKKYLQIKIVNVPSPKRKLAQIHYFKRASYVFVLLLWFDWRLLSTVFMSEPNSCWVSWQPHIIFAAFIWGVVCMDVLELYSLMDRNSMTRGSGRSDKHVSSLEKMTGVSFMKTSISQFSQPFITS